MELKNFYSSVKKNIDYLDKSLNIKGCVNENDFILVFESFTDGKKSNIINYKYGLSGKFGDRSYDGIRGFIARQDDVLQLKTFDDIFYTMRLDYEGNTFVYNREIAYIDFKSSDYSKTNVPIATKHGGIKDWDQPFEGLGITKAKNGQIVREYTVQDGSYLTYEEAVMYKIDKNGNTIKIAVYDKFEEKWIKE